MIKKFSLFTISSKTPKYIHNSKKKKKKKKNFHPNPHQIFLKNTKKKN